MKVTTEEVIAAKKITENKISGLDLELGAVCGSQNSPNLTRINIHGMFQRRDFPWKVEAIETSAKFEKKLFGDPSN